MDEQILSQLRNGTFKKKTAVSYRKLLKNVLASNASWLYDESLIEGRINFRSIFDHDSTEFSSTPTNNKILVLQEAFYCGLSPMILNSIYKDYCEDMGNEYYPYATESLLEIIKDLTAEDLALDIQDPKNWYNGNKRNSSSYEEHELIISALKDFSSKLYKQLIDSSDLVMKKRLIFFNNDNENYYILPNKNSDLNKIDDELLNNIGTLKNDLKSKGNIHLLIEEIRNKICPDYRKKMIDLGKMIDESIVENDLNKLKDLPILCSSEYKNPVQIKEHHTLITWNLKNVPTKFLKEIIKTTDVEIRRNMILFYSFEKMEIFPFKNSYILFDKKYNTLYVPNKSDKLDKVDNELLLQVKNIELDVMDRYHTFDEFVEDICDKF